MLRLLVISLLSLFLLAPAAGAQTRLYGEGHRPWMDRCLKKSLVPTPESSIEIVRVSGGRSIIEPWAGGRIELAYHDSRREDCHVLLHELGHLFDWAYLTPSERSQVGCRIFGSQQRIWWSLKAPGGWVKGGEGVEGPLEWFAEAYKIAATVRNLPRGRDWSYFIPEWLIVGYGVHRVLDRRRLAQVRRVIVKASSRPADRSERDQRLPLSC